jgi:hypothetical protein
MYEGEVVPDDWEGEWGGFTVCEGCYFDHRPEEKWDYLVKKHTKSTPQKEHLKVRYEECVT